MTITIVKGAFMALNSKVKKLSEEIRLEINDLDALSSLSQLIAVQALKLDDLNRQLGLLKAQVQIRDILLPEAKLRYKNVNFAKLDAGMPLSADSGFYALEYDQKGRHYRWTGPESTFHFNFHLDRTSPLKFTLLVQEPDRSLSTKLRCFTDHIECPLVCVDVEDSCEYSGILFPREIYGLTCLTFQVPKVFIPNSDGDSMKDIRTLGVMFRQIAISPATKEDEEAYLLNCDDFTKAAFVSQMSAPVAS